MSLAAFLASLHLYNAIPPAVIKDNAAFTSNVIDTAIAGGADELVFVVQLGAIDADVSVLKVMGSGTKTNATTLGGTPVEVVDVLDTFTPGDDDTNNLVVVRIDLKGEHQKYIQLQATAGNGAAGTYLSALAFFTNAGVPLDNMGAVALIAA